MALNKQSASPFEGKWLFLLEASLDSLLSPRSSTLQSRWVKRTGGGFKRKAIVRLAGLLLVVYISNRLQSHSIVSDIFLQSVPTGMFNLMVSAEICVYRVEISGIRIKGCIWRSKYALFYSRHAHCHRSTDSDHSFAQTISTKIIWVDKRSS